MSSVNNSSLEITSNPQITVTVITAPGSGSSNAGNLNVAAPRSASGSDRGIGSNMSVTGAFGGRETESFVSQMSGGLKSIRTELNNTSGGAKALMNSLLGVSNPIGIIMAGVNGLGKVCTTVYNNWISSMKEAGELAQRNAAGIRENAAANEALRQKSDGYLNQLAGLASAEQLSNTNKAEAQKLIGDLSKSYGDLGISIDEATGKITGVDTAMTTKLQRDKDRRIKEMESELKQLQSDNKAQERLRDNAGIPVSFSGDTRIGGEAEIQSATAKLEENNKRIMDLKRQIGEQKRADPAGDYLKKRAAENEDLTKKYVARNQQLEQRQADDAYADLKDPEKKIANRQALIDQEKSDRSPKEEQIKELEKAAALTTNTATRLEKKRQMRQLQLELIQSDEKIYSWQRQIQEIESQRAQAAQEKESQRTRAAQELLASTQDETRLQQLLIRGQHEEYEAEKLRQELKQKNLTLTAKETQELLAQRKAMGGEKLRGNLVQQASGLKKQAMEKSGLGREAAEMQALEDARKLKGSELTADETGMVKKLSELSYSQNNSQQPQPSDTSIKSNSLTSRGGFAGGAKTPDSTRINREIAATAKLQLEMVQKINSILSELTAG